MLAYEKTTCSTAKFHDLILFQIRSLRAPNALVQTVVLRDVQKLVQTDNCILAALSNSVHGLLPVPIGAQVFLSSLLIMI